MKKNKINLLEQKRDLSPQELTMLSIELDKRKKSSVTLWLLWLFTGTLGGHRYYLGDFANAILHTFTFLLMLLLAGLWNAYIMDTVTRIDEAMIYAPMGVLFLGVPALWALIDAFIIGSRLVKRNTEIELFIINQIKRMRS